MPLTDRDRAILDLERTWWSEPGPERPSGAGKIGPKAAAIQTRIGLSPARYYQVLSALIGSAEAAAYDPLVVRRLRKMRSNRRRARIEGGRTAQPRGR
jgi:hypothetical protein